MLREYIYQQIADRKLAVADAKRMLGELAARRQLDEIAIVGIACRFPGADDAHEFWRNLAEGRCSIGPLPPHRHDDAENVWGNPTYMDFLTGQPGRPVAPGEARFEPNGYLRETDLFDAEFFGIPPREATFIDPMQRKLLETFAESLEDAGYGGDALVDSRTGVFVGRLTDVALYRYMSAPDPLLLTGTWDGMLASRISYLLNFRGPALVVDTACSSSLVAVHLACQALREGECEVALAAGVCVGYGALKQDRGPMDMKAVEASDGRVRSFDDGATGTVWGEGAGAVVLKPLARALADGDHVYAVIKGSGVNNDGASNGITAPNAVAQEELLTRVWTQAQIAPETISYVETHGTGTALGDPVEVRGLTNAFARSTRRRQFCGIGSVKTNIGHTVGAAGIASLLKVVLAMKHRALPASIHFERPNRYINFADSPLYVTDRLAPWRDQDGGPLRAGVSAFGFSGTNAHVLLQEAPARAPRPPTCGAHCLTLSARSATALDALIARFLAHAAELPGEVDAVCHTSNVGRGHYAHRAAVVCRDRAGLLRGLAALRDGVPLAGTFRGAHRVVSERQRVRGEGERTRRELDALGAEATEQLTSAARGDDHHDAAPLEGVAALYVQGATVRWAVRYAARVPGRVPLPTYPFERRRFWAPRKEARAQAGAQGDSLGHPLLDRRIVESDGLTLYATTIDARKDWCVAEHRVLGSAVVPGTALLELVLEVGRRALGEAALEVGELLFLAPLRVDDDAPREVHTQVHTRDGKLAVTIASRSAADEAGSFTQHATAEVRRIDAQRLRARAAVRLDHDVGAGERVTLAPDPEGLLTFGPRWQNDRVVRVLGERTVATLALRPEHVGDLTGRPIHPALLDNAVNIAGAHRIGAADRDAASAAYLPFAYRGFRLYRPMPARVIACARPLAGQPLDPAAPLLGCSLQLFDDDGALFAEVDAYTLKRFDAARLRAPATLPAHALRWGEAAPARAPAQADEPDDVRGASIMLLRGESALADVLAQQLRAAGARVLEQPVARDADGVEAHAGAIAARLERAAVTRLVIVADDASHPDEPGAPLDHAAAAALSQLFFLVRAIVRAKHKLELVVVGRGAQRVVADDVGADPTAAALFALTQVVEAEYPQLRCRALDVDAATDPRAWLPDVRASGEAHRVAWRAGRRYLQALHAAALPPASALALREGGTYVITGGTGGIGLALARHLAGTARVKLALIGRSEVPARDRWDALVAAGTDGRAVGVIAALRAIEASGSEVRTYAADTGDRAQLAGVLEAVRSELGPVRGVVHCAGVAGGGFLLNKEHTSFTRVLRAKLFGTRNLDLLTRADAPDFFVLFSSLFALVGAPGQGDYAAGNAFLDAYALHRSARVGPTVSLAWPAWSETGMAVEHGLEGEALFRSVSNAEALAYFDRTVGGAEPGLIPAALDLVVLARATHALRFGLSPALRTRVAELAGTPAALDEHGEVAAEVALRGKAEHEYSEVERTLGALWAGMLGLSELDVHDNYHALGGDSLMAQRLVKAIERAFPGAVDITDIFSYPSVAQLAAQITARTAPASLPPPVEVDADADDAAESLEAMLQRLEHGGASVDDVLEALR